jgi:hypothetical protein
MCHRIQQGPAAVGVGAAVGDIDTTDQVRPPDDVSGETPSGLALTRPALKIFMNYRHEDVPFAAAALYAQLKRRFGAENIFFDGGTLRPGMDFLREIKTSLNGAAGAFIALIGPNWLSAMDARWRRDAHDYVLQELELGLRNGWTVIPVLLDGAPRPQAGDLPPAIRALCGYQVAQLRHASLDKDIADLAGWLDEISVRLHIKPPEVKPPEVQPPEVQPPEFQAREIFPAGDEHYQELVDEADNLVIFLGAGANADDREGPFQVGGLMLPDDSDLAEYLAAKARLKTGQRELAEVAQYARMVRGEPRMLSWVKEIIAVDSKPGPVHTYLARLPARLLQLGLEKRYQMIVTPKFDVALEQALREAKEPFDVAVYMAPGTQHAGRFVHIPWDSRDARPIVTPNEYDQFPIVGDNLELTRTVIVRINGAVDDDTTGYPWKMNYVITEDHYIDYLGGRPAEEVVPMQILAKLRQASCLFLGYTIADWRLRVFLHWIWPGERPRDATHWAVQRDPDVLERRFWERSGVPLYRSRLTEYIQGFDRFLVEHRDELLWTSTFRSRRGTTPTSDCHITTSNSARSSSAGRSKAARSSQPTGGPADSAARRERRREELAATGRRGVAHAKARGRHVHPPPARSVHSRRVHLMERRSLPRPGRVRGCGDPAVPGRAPGPALPPDRLDLAIEGASKAVNGSLLIMLDQFEEYFLYRSREPAPERFADELTRCINRTDLRATSSSRSAKTHTPDSSTS